MIISARDNRNELQTIYKQFISRILINSIDESIMLATVYLSINSVELKKSIEINFGFSRPKKTTISLSVLCNSTFNKLSSL